MTVGLRPVMTLSTILFAATFSFAQSDGPGDNSDWWSIIRESSTNEGLKPEQQDVGDSNFRVLGVVVGSDNLEAIQRKLGTAKVIARGDASTGRSQICYAGADGKTYLTFEVGEVQYAFYLFTRGPQWPGSDQCAKSRWVTPGLKTSSGLHLGQTRSEVRGILGEPTGSRGSGDLVYFRQRRKKTSAADLKKAREQYPKMSEKDLHENYDFCDVSFYIVAKFSSSRLVYLGLSKSETY